jgi:cell division septation protein DedD
MDEKQKRDAALNLADFKIDDMSSLPGDRLLAEVAEDFGDPAYLAAAFDAIAFPVIANQGGGAVDEGAAALSAARATPGPAPVALQALPRASRAPRSSPRAALATLAEWVTVPLRRRIVLGALATLVLVAVLTPGIYLHFVDRSADQFAAGSKDDPVTRLPELTRLPAPTAPQPQPEISPTPPSSANQSAAAPTAPPPASARAPSLAEVRQAPPPTEERQGPPAPRAAAAPAPIPQPMAAAPGEPSAEASARGRLSVQRQAAAKSDLAEGNGFVVQLSAAKSEAEAQSTLRALKSKYAALDGREPTVRRKEQGKRGVFYAVQVGPFETQQAAEQLCARIKAAGGSCFATKN